jgi:hypothetical protein
VISETIYYLISFIGILVFIYLIIQYVRWLSAEGLLGGIKLALYAFIFILLLSNA